MVHDVVGRLILACDETKRGATKGNTVYGDDIGGWFRNSNRVGEPKTK